ncbi:RES domain-containing protein, partial [Bacillus sp. JJ664]
VRTINLKNKKIFRARVRNTKERAIHYTSAEMFKAPYGKPSQGRYNIVGHGELYTCSNKEVAVTECKKGNNDVIDVVEWEVLENLNLIDLTNKESPLVKYCSYNADTSLGLEYLVPNFISQCAKSKGITGLVHKSTKDENALNYVFFDYLEKWFRFVNMHEM